MTPAFYRERALRCLDHGPGLLPAGFGAVFQLSHDFGPLETVSGTLPEGLARRLRTLVGKSRHETALVVLEKSTDHDPGVLAPGSVLHRLEGWPVLQSRDPLADLARLAASLETARSLRADELLRELGKLPPADAQSPEAGRRHVTPGAGLL